MMALEGRKVEHYCKATKYMQSVQASYAAEERDLCLRAWITSRASEIVAQLASTRDSRQLAIHAKARFSNRRLRIICTLESAF